ncbi:MAG: hypothetical protein Q4A78_09950 [Peptostreptococcaceae bacterium]|nr:hypothetical protein [Peptostreptococcaceae bacterium]
MKKEKVKNISFNKSGTNGVTPKMTLPLKWLEDMGVTEDEREVKLKYSEKNKKITITKNEK